ncbi:MAG TPA: VWA domain-containing protein [Pyrinomonadaceae bacterium]|nr:VWA domain-containing protein [Pyrinomonadaceae bacterium]
MLSHTFPLRRASVLLLALCLLPGLHTRAQQPSPTAPPADTSDEVVRVNTELVQTDVIVLDKEGKFVDGLKPEQFELRVNGKPQPISFFERVTAGSVNEDAQLAAARGGGSSGKLPATAGGTATAVKPLDRGRNVLFFVDDLHLSSASLARTRTLLLRFVEEQMRQNDQAMIATATNQLGFLQQLTDDRRVLRAAVSRLSPREVNVRDFGRPAMSELQALAIDQNDPNVLNYFIEAVLRETPMFGNQQSARNSAESQVRQRATQIAQTSITAATNTLYSLRNMLRSLAPLPGRKVVYFISDGFPVELRRSDMGETLRRVTDAAARAGVVVYTLDARGLTVAGLPDAASDAAPDLNGQLSGAALNEATARQEPLRLIAEDTGGRALLNTNALADALAKAFKETSVYYLLAWRPESTEGRNAKFQRIEVSVRERPDVSVYVQRGYYTTPPPEPAARAKDAKRGNDAKEKDAPAAAAGKTQNKELIAALHSLYPKAALPTSLALNYFNLPPRGMILTTSIQIDLGAPTPPAADKAQPAADARAQPAANAKTPSEQIELVGALYDERGELKDAFQQTLGVQPDAAKAATTDAAHAPAEPRRLIASTHLPITSGIYQVRIAARDPQSGRTGSAAQWIEIPDISKGKLAMSSIFLGEHTNKETAPVKDAEADTALPVVITINRRLARTSRLRFFTYIYNAARANGQPDIALQVQVFRDDQPVITAPLRKLATDGMTDLSSLPYAAELSMSALASGSYALHITAIDRVSKTTTTQRAKFMVE